MGITLLAFSEEWKIWKRFYFIFLETDQERGEWNKQEGAYALAMHLRTSPRKLSLTEILLIPQILNRGRQTPLFKTRGPAGQQSGQFKMTIVCLLTPPQKRFVSVTLDDGTANRPCHGDCFEREILSQIVEVG